MTELYFSPSQIIFDRRIVIWLLENFALFREGIWPSDWSSYTVPSGGGKPSRNLAQDTALELDARIIQCKPLDGLFLEAYYSWDRSLEHISYISHYSVEEVERRINRALSYISSGRDRRWHDTKKRKGVTYRDWISHRRSTTP